MKPIARTRTSATIALALLLAGCGILPAAPGTNDPDNPPRYVNVARSSEIRVQLVPQDAASAPPNQHPAAFQKSQLEALLGTLRLRPLPEADPAGNTTLTSVSRLQTLAKDLSRAFAQAGPRQDVVFAVFRRVSQGLLSGSSRRVTTARMFYRNDTLNILFGELDDAFSPFRKLSINGFDYGDRGQAQKVAFRRLIDTGTWHWHADRRDWIEMPATRSAIAAAKQAVPKVVETSTGAAATSFDYGPAAAPAGQPDTAGRAGAPNPAETRAEDASRPQGAGQSPPTTTAATAPSTPPNAGAASSSRAWQRIEQRLTELKHLREKNLITAKDYQQKKDALLRQLP